MAEVGMETYVEPTMDQLVNFAAVLVSQKIGEQANKDLIRQMFEDHEDVRQGWLAQHREFQEAAFRL